MVGDVIFGEQFVGLGAVVVLGGGVEYDFVIGVVGLWWIQLVVDFVLVLL